LFYKKKIQFNFYREIFKFKDTGSYYYICTIFITFITFAFFENFLGGQDAQSDYLPLARFLSLNHFLPQDIYSIEKVPFLRTTYPPAIHGMGALLFQIIGLHKAWVAAIVPLTFSLLFIILVLRWSAYNGTNLIFPTMAILMSPFFIERMTWFYQESLLTFMVTLMLYCLWRFEHYRKNEYLFSAIAISSVTMLIKATGIFFALFLIYFILSRRLYSKRNLILLLILYIFTPLLWYGHNLYFWGNPLPPLANFLTISKTSFHIFSSVLKVSGQQNFNKWYNVIFNLIALPFFYLWFILELFSINKNIKKMALERDIFIFIIIYCLIWELAISSIFDFRFFMPFYGYIIVRSTKNLESLIENRGNLPVLEKLYSILIIKRYLVILIFSLVVIAFQFSYVKWIFPDQITPYRDVTNFLRKEMVHKDKKSIVLVDTDHGLRWFGDLYVVEPFQPQVAADFLQTLESGNILRFIQKHQINYIVNSPWISPWEDNFFSKIEKNKGNFIKIYEKGHMTVWKVVQL
jgi:hypothetical protein